MNKREESKLEMVKDVQTLLGENESIISKNAPLTALKEELVVINDELLEKEGVLKVNPKAKTENKHAKEDDLIYEAVVMAGAIYAYAETAKNTDLQVQMDIEENDFRRMRDADIPVTVDLILKKAAEYSRVLGPYGIVEDTRVMLKAKLDSYLITAGQQGAGKVDKGSARDLITSYFARIDVILTVMDKLMKGYEKSNYEFYSKYCIARIIRDKPSGTRNKEDENENPSENDSDKQK